MAKASRVSEANPTTQERRPDIRQAGPHTSSYPAPHIVIPEKAGIQRGGEGRGKAVPRCIGGQAGLPRAPAPRFVIPAAPPRHSGPPTSSFRRRTSSCRRRTSSFRRRPESRGAVRSVARLPGHRRPSRPPKSAGPPDSSFRPPDSSGRPPTSSCRPPHFVIPAKAGIQRGGEWRGRPFQGASEAKPACQERRRPDSSFRRPTSSFRRPTSSCRPPISSFRRRPESRGAVRGVYATEAHPLTQPPNSSPTRRPTQLQPN